VVKGSIHTWEAIMLLFGPHAARDFHLRSIKAKAYLDRIGTT